MGKKLIINTYSASISEHDDHVPGVLPFGRRTALKKVNAFGQ